MVTTKWHGKHASATIEKLCFVRGPWRSYFENNWGDRESSEREAVKKIVARVLS
jgi:hypothetical protein